ncbi:MAG: hypothetical protein ABSB67_04665 [Bryobacteraceae bacterium]
MTARLLLAAAIFPIAALAQLELTLYDPSSNTETPMGSSFNIGTAAACQTLSSPEVRLRNIGPNAIDVTTVAPLNGAIVLSQYPLPPFQVASQSLQAFYVAFTPTGPGPATSTLTVTGNDVVTSTVYNLSVALSATGVAAPTLTDSGGNSYCPGAEIYIGRTQVGTTLQTSLTLNNTTPNAVTATVSGQDFGPTGPVTVLAGAVQTLPISFTPSIPNTETGTLTVSGLVYNLTGVGFAQAVTTLDLSLQLSSNADLSSNQATVSIPLASPAALSDVGTLTLSFQPAGSLPDDPAIMFMANSSRTVSVEVSPGDTAVQFQAGNATQCTFQTGTTAGTITLTLNLTVSGVTTSTSSTIAPALISLDLSTAVAATDSILLSLSGFDNTHAASALAFTFFDTTGKAIPPGLIQSNVANAFASYYQANPQAGGTFNLQATFPVTGDITQVATVQVKFTNPAGVTTTSLLPVD